MTTVPVGLLTLALLPIRPIPTAATQPVCRSIPPSETSSELDPGWYDHYVCFDPAASRKGVLLLFLAGTRADPSRYSLLMKEAARGGLHAVSLGYLHRFAVNLEICPFQDDADCHEKVRREILYGEGFEPLDIDRPNSVVGRLGHLLRHLSARYPSEDWGRFLDAEQQPVWSSILVSGHSQGGGHATMLARDHSVARLVVFAWTDRSQGGLAPWIEAPFATPAEDMFAFEHRRDRGLRLRRVMWRVLGMDRFGPEIDVDTAEPPYGGSHTLSTNVEATRPHSSVAVDDVTPLREDGSPVLRDVWRYLLNVPGAAGATTTSSP